MIDEERWVHTAIIPAAGRGVRLAPLTNTIPKPLVPVLDTPALARCVAEADAAGVRRVLVVTPGAPCVDEMVQRAVHGMAPRVELVHQPSPRGVGDAVRRALPRLRPDDHWVAVLLPDVVAVGSTEPLRELIALAVARSGSAVNLIPRPAAEAGEHGVADIGSERLLPGVPVRVRRVVEKPATWDGGPTIGVVGGRYVLSRSACAALAAEEAPREGEHGLDTTLTGAADGGRLHGLSSGEDLVDIGHAAGYVAAWVRTALADPALHRVVSDVVARHGGPR